MADDDSSFSFIHGRKQQKEKNIVDSTGYGFIIVVVLCLLFIVFQCHSTNYELSYSI